MDDKQQLRELIIRARIYRLLALVFVVCGGILFLVMYIQNVEGNFFAALQNPFIILILIIPFLPSAVLSWMAVRIEKKAVTLLETIDRKA